MISSLIFSLIVKVFQFGNCNLNIIDCFVVFLFVRFFQNCTKDKVLECCISHYLQNDATSLSEVSRLRSTALHHSANNEKYNTPKLCLFCIFCVNSSRQKQSKTIKNVQIAISKLENFYIIQKIQIINNQNFNF